MSRRIDNIANRIVSLAAKQPAPRLVLILDDGSKRNVFGGLPESLVHLQLPDGCCVASIEKPEQLDSLTEQLYELFECIVMGGVSVSDARNSLLYADDSYLLPPEEPTEDEAISERNHNLI